MRRKAASCRPRHDLTPHRLIIGEGVLAVEMEAAALYAFGHARNKPVLCIAHVTNRLGCFEGDFEKGDHNGARSSLSLIRVIAERWRPSERKTLSGERTIL